MSNDETPPATPAPDDDLPLSADDERLLNEIQERVQALDASLSQLGREMSAILRDTPASDASSADEPLDEPAQ